MSKVNTDFKEKILSIVRDIKKGNVLTYKSVAEKANRPLAMRAVGTIMKNNYDPTVPCHRVVRSDGKIGDYNRGGSEAKIKLLKSEGVKIERGRVAFL